MGVRPTRRPHIFWFRWDTGLHRRIYLPACNTPYSEPAVGERFLFNRRHYGSPVEVQASFQYRIRLTCEDVYD